MKSIWDRSAREDIYERLERIGPSQQPLWGKMDPGQMVAHLAEPVLSMMGEVPAAARKSPLRFPPLRFLVIYVLPWPKGAPTAPEYVMAGSHDIAAERRRYRDSLERLAARDPKLPIEPHPAFGAMQRKDWGCLVWRHADHHLRQFGA